MLVSSTKDNIKKTADEKYTIESVDLVTVIIIIIITIIWVKQVWDIFYIERID